MSEPTRKPEQPLLGEMAGLNNEVMDLIRSFVDERGLSRDEREYLRETLRDSLDEVIYGGPTAGAPIERLGEILDRPGHRH